MPKPKWFREFRKELPSMVGKTVAITGCTTGTGRLCARVCAELGAKVVMLNRESARADAAFLEICSVAEKAGAPEPMKVSCDLMSFSSVRQAAESVCAHLASEGLDVLCNNAGIMGHKDEVTVDGFDIQMQTNHLSHFLLTSELFHLLERAASLRGEARVVNHSSIARETPGIKCNLDGKFFEPHDAGSLGGDADVGPMKGPRFHRYQQTKLANVVFTYALDKRLRKAGSKVKALCAHPGVAPTELGPSMMNTGTSMNPCIGAIFATFFMQSVEDATMGILRGCCDPSAKSKDFYGPVGKGLTGMKGKADLLPEEPLADADAEALLWTASCNATKCSFDICSSMASPSLPNNLKWVGA